MTQLAEGPTFRPLASRRPNAETVEPVSNWPGECLEGERLQDAPMPDEVLARVESGAAAPPVEPAAAAAEGEPAAELWSMASFCYTGVAVLASLGVVFAFASTLAVGLFILLQGAAHP
jgi:hypothetical protein